MYTSVLSLLIKKHQFRTSSLNNLILFKKSRKIIFLLVHRFLQFSSINLYSMLLFQRNKFNSWGYKCFKRKKSKLEYKCHHFKNQKILNKMDMSSTILKLKNHLMNILVKSSAQEDLAASKSWILIIGISVHQM